MIQHKELAAGRWFRLSFAEQMTNIGSEISRALNWRNKNKTELSRNAVNRSLELLALTIKGNKTYARLKELCRVKELIIDFFYGQNIYGSSEKLWRRYFDHFNNLIR